MRADPVTQPPVLRRPRPEVAGRTAYSVQENSAGPGEVVVHVSGQVNSPGVVTIAAPGRVIDAVEEAGGPTPEADLALINLAEPIVDGAHIHVPAHGEGEAIAGVAGGGEPPDASDVRRKMGVLVMTASMMASAPTVYSHYKNLYESSQDRTNLIRLRYTSCCQIESDLENKSTRVGSQDNE